MENDSDNDSQINNENDSDNDSENNSENNSDNNKSIAFHFQTFWENIESSHFNKILNEIFNREIDISYKEKLALWIHKQSLKDKNIYKILDNKLINEIYKYISNDIIKIVIQNLDDYNIQTIECSICLSTLDKPFAGDCGHVFCKTCIDKHVRISSLRQNEPKCPKCKQNVINIKRIYI